MSKRFWAEINDEPSYAIVSQSQMAGSQSQRRFVKAKRPMKKMVPVRQRGNVSYIKGRVTAGNQGPEIKTADLVVSGQTVSTTGYIVSILSGLPQGTSSLTRVGNDIKVKAVNVKCQIYQTAGNTGVNFARWSLVLDKQPDGVTPVIGSIFANATSNLTQLTVANLDRFQILACGDLDEPLLQGVCLGKYFDKYIKCDIGTRFQDATGEAITNSLYFTVTIQASAGNPILVDLDIRTRWTDM